MIELVEKNGGVEFSVRAVPRASATEIAGEIDGAVKIRISAPPVDGAANEELVRYLSKRLKISRTCITIVSGSTSKTKRVRIIDASAREIANLLSQKSA